MKFSMAFFHNLFKRKPQLPEAAPPERLARELLRENLSTIPVDFFYSDDPLVGMPPEDRREYLKYFNEVLLDRKLIDRIRYLINKQARMTLTQSKGGEFDIAGSMNINGLAVVKEDIERLSTMFIKENSLMNKSFNKMGI